MRKSKGATRREERALRAAERTGWNMYSIHDSEAVAKRLKIQHVARQALAQKHGLPAPTDRDLVIAYTRNHVKYLRAFGRLGKYTPHQGARECARRVRQVACG